MKLIEITEKNFFQEKNDFEIDVPEIGAEIFRNYVETQKNMKKQKDANLCKSMYSKLSLKGQYIVNNAILDFVPEYKRTQNFGNRFSILLNQVTDNAGKPLTLYKMAQYIHHKNLCLMNRKKHIYEDSAEDLRAKLKSFQSKSKSQEQSDFLEQDVSTIFSCDIEVLSVGKGYMYDINWNNVSSILKSKKENEDIFFRKAVDNYIECSNCKCTNCKSKIQEYYIQFKQLDKYSYAENIALLFTFSMLYDEEYFSEWS